ncbi:MAG: hypothetical protein M3N97_17110, partial [Pseudomonadota bacterium]|nr:hypothetical protein [Pseudomonadota bacterium]
MSIVYLRFAARRPDTPQRSPLLEQLLARARPARVADWRAEAFRVLAPHASSTPPIAPTALATASSSVSPSNGAPGTAPEPWCCIATPVHLSAGMTSVTMPQDGLVELRAAEAKLLAEDFNRTFVGAGMRLVVGRAATLVCVFDRTLQVATHDPESMAGQDVFAFQPAGSDAPRLRRLMSEMEMWLFDHAVNRARTREGALPITGLWLWGGGAIMAASTASTAGAGVRAGAAAAPAATAVTV